MPLKGRVLLDLTLHPSHRAVDLSYIICTCYTPTRSGCLLRLSRGPEKSCLMGAREVGFDAEPQDPPSPSLVQPSFLSTLTPCSPSPSCLLAPVGWRGLSVFSMCSEDCWIRNTRGVVAKRIQHLRTSLCCCKSCILGQKEESTHQLVPVDQPSLSPGQAVLSIMADFQEPSGMCVGKRCFWMLRFGR